MSTITPAKTDREEAVAALAGLFAAGRKADSERRPYVDACLDAAVRLAAFAWRERDESEQAPTIAAALASIYNGGNARRVRLDEIRWLDWQHQIDLIAVMLGTGHTSTPDTHIRHAFRACGGEPAVDWLHSHLDHED